MSPNAQFPGRRRNAKHEQRETAKEERKERETEMPRRPVLKLKKRGR